MKLLKFLGISWKNTRSNSWKILLNRLNQLLWKFPQYFLEKFPKKILEKFPNVLLEEFPRFFRLTPKEILRITSGVATERIPGEYPVRILGGICGAEFLHAGGMIGISEPL